MARSGSGIPEEHRRRAIRLRLSRMEIPEAPPAISTGFRPLDQALDGGMPRARIIELFGPASSGKSTLALQIAARIQSTGAFAGWIDADHTFDPAYAAGLGVVLDRLPLAQPDSAEQALEIARKLALSGAVELIVLDSAAALVPHLELDSELGAGNAGLQARALASGLRSLSFAIAKTGTCLLVLNQTRSRWSPSAGEPETTAGGTPLKLHAAVRIALAGSGARRVHFRILKNKGGAAFREGALVWNPGRGFVESL